MISLLFVKVEPVGQMVTPGQARLQASEGTNLRFIGLPMWNGWRQMCVDLLQLQAYSN